ncbi:lasso RiPP family leader peptide-containing protein [Halomonas rhizosphaerae]|uniref:lasso RiPP family leader peptide-containing protein n=1 Tax=Halomonas rhizosphaerae TaxID=3043296 RepID=UPI0038994677
MHHVERKCYETPTLNELGDLKEITQNGNAANSDSQQFIDNSAWGNGELAS